jgi:anti-sigma regulatory factor (Ser/Thr protein kinase)
MLQLEVINTAFAGKKMKLMDNLTIGSGKGSSIRAKTKGMKPKHARFYAEGNRFFVEVISTEAHVFRNGKDVLRAELHHNDRLIVGPLRFKVIDTEAGIQPRSRLDELLDQAEEEASNQVYDFAQEDLFYLTTKDPTLRQHINFTIPSRDRFINQAQAFLARLVRQSSMDEMKVEAFITCTNELVLNAHRHGHKFDGSKTITISYKDLGNAIQLVIKDQGNGFDHEKALGSVQSVDAAEAARARYLAGGFGGLGFQMITRLADDVSYNEMGNEVTFRVNKDF